MPEDLVKSAEDATRGTPTKEIDELRGAVQELGRELRKFGKKRLVDLGHQIETESTKVVRSGREVLHDIERRLAALEKDAEQSVKQHPGAWAGGLLGVVGFGLVLGMILRRPH
ncbi:hypothetical protein [Histidinibacterium aquaticum]|uniref:DUF883 family protein n=1 Tax=Histidinibacterium aquaticum TaxID=2613962 RepID=A0A5J5GG66_9RHOB|nr:hypothetical protein [Histidinibacterium aquaticum]KAA9006713.1 hypothetical protein F3S47_13085 [Histidinibacterium aquaticum]